MQVWSIMVRLKCIIIQNKKKNNIKQFRYTQKWRGYRSRGPDKSPHQTDNLRRV
jgi:hypothetical protein